MELSSGPADWEIRRARLEDAAAISRLAQELTRRFIARDCTEEGLRFLLGSLEPEAIGRNIATDCRYHVAESRGEIIGAVAVHENRHLYHLFVAEAFQRRGVGRELWQAARAASVAAGNPDRFTVNAACSVCAVYERLGFTAASAPVRKNGILTVPMRFVPPAAD